jgi:outer membrane lipoprotein-sorting protein
MKKFLLIFLLINFNSIALSSIKENIINNLLNTKNLSFDFEQNINGKVETGNCVIEYPKKIYCKYNNLNGKILVSNGKSLVIKTKNGIYYRYAIKRTPLNYILDKKFLINQIQSLKQRVIDDRFINFTIFRDENEINVFFDIENFDLIGWQTLDIYQNLNITYLSFLKKNQILKKNFFKLPSLN